MASHEQDQNRWVVDLGGGDTFAIERTAAGLVAISIPSRREVIADRAAVEDLRRKLGAAIAVEGGSDGAG
jgi:hypothetical protein